MEYDGWYPWWGECEAGNHDFRRRKVFRVRGWRVRRVEVEECRDCEIRRPL